MNPDRMSAEEYRRTVCGAAKDPVRQLTGKRNKAQGEHFEARIMAACGWYETAGVADIKKTPEPMKVAKRLEGSKFVAFFAKRAQPDFKGVLKGGRAVMFEAKHTTGDRIDYSRVSHEQLTALLSAERLGALCFILVGFDPGDVYALPLKEWVGMEHKYGRKYIRREECGRPVPQTAGVPLFLESEEL